METVKEENEKKKEYLKQYGKALRQEKRIEEELERLNWIGCFREHWQQMGCQKAAAFPICRIIWRRLMNWKEN